MISSFLHSFLLSSLLFARFFVRLKISPRFGYIASNWTVLFQRVGTFFWVMDNGILEYLLLLGVYKQAIEYMYTCA